RQQIIVDRIMAENKSLQQEQESVLADESNSLVARLRRALSVDPITLLPEWFPLRRIPSDEYREILELRKEEIRFELSRLRGIVDDMDRREQALLRKLTETKP
ncbi:hypothetical protein FB639_005443, partial [Coemansia asiatica]